MIFDKNKEHLLPQILVDNAERLLREPIEGVKENYAMRFEAVRDYCNHILELHKKTKAVSPRKGKRVA